MGLLPVGAYKRGGGGGGGGGIAITGILPVKTVRVKLRNHDSIGDTAVLDLDLRRLLSWLRNTFSQVLHSADLDTKSQPKTFTDPSIEAFLSRRRKLASPQETHCIHQSRLKCKT